MTKMITVSKEKDPVESDKVCGERERVGGGGEREREGQREGEGKGETEGESSGEVTQTRTG